MQRLGLLDILSRRAKPSKAIGRALFQVPLYFLVHRLDHFNNAIHIEIASRTTKVALMLLDEFANPFPLCLVVFEPI